MKTLLRLAIVAASAVFITTTQANATVFSAVPDGIDAYVYGYPLVTMEFTRRVMTNVREPEGTRAPMGQFVRARHYPDATFRDVTAPTPTRSTPRPGSTSPKNPGS